MVLDDNTYPIACGQKNKSDKSRREDHSVQQKDRVCLEMWISLRDRQAFKIGANDANLEKVRLRVLLTSIVYIHVLRNPFLSSFSSGIDYGCSSSSLIFYL